MKSNIILKLFGGCAFALLALFVISVIPQVGTAEALFGAGAASFAQIYGTGRAGSPPANYIPPQYIPPGGGSGGGSSYYCRSGIIPMFDTFTLFADNSLGALGVFKMQSSDTLVESAQNASLGANLFVVQNLNTVAAIDYAAQALTGLNCVRRYLQSVAIVVEYINYVGSDATQLINSLTVLQADPQGNVRQSTLPVAPDISNMQQNPNLVPIGKNWILTFNHALKLTVNAASTAQLVFKVKNIVDYSKIVGV